MVKNRHFGLQNRLVLLRERQISVADCDYIFKGAAVFCIKISPIISFINYQKLPLALLLALSMNFSFRILLRQMRVVWCGVVL